ncbi:MAG: DsrE/DsrF/DrsH-like family protein, partial [Verrucomicrobiota bacterium]|nr:DsrE/DsrF/DrsH-like family protein [Verrucomicrobiota bacterium]
AELILRGNGFDVSNIAGGYISWLLFHSESGSVLNEDSCWIPAESDNVQDTLDSSKYDIDTELNACGLQCPGPIVALKNKLELMQDGQILKVTASDMGFYKDLPSWCSATKNELLSISKNESKVTGLVKKTSLKAPLATPNSPISKKTTLVLFSNDLDKSMAAFILATGFASLNHEVTIFFTFWGLNVLRKDNPPPVKKDFLSRMFGMMMPRGAKKLALSKMHMMGMGTEMMKYVMNSKNVDSLPGLIKQAQSLGIKFVACEMAMDVMGITREELIDNVDTAGVANFAAIAEQSGTTLFI